MSRWLVAARALAALLLWLPGVGALAAAGPPEDPGLALRARHAQLRHELEDNPFHRPLHLVSSDTPDRVAGEVLAVLDAPYETTLRALQVPGQWCELMLLHLNTKLCSVSAEPVMLHLSIGRKFDQPLDKASRIDFIFRAEAASPRYLSVVLHADTGPMVTHDYRIRLEAAPTDDGKTVLRLSYSYGFGIVARLAGETYLGTVGRNKVGFTIIDHDTANAPVYIGGMRGLVERNTMRYYLAIEAYLLAQSLPPEARQDASLRSWFEAIERFPRQLHEMELADYLDMKRREYLRQGALAASTVR